MGKKKATVYLFLTLILCGLLAGPVYAAGGYTEPGSTSMTKNWANAVKCHVLAGPGGNTTVIYSVLKKSSQSLMVDVFSKEGKRKSHKSIAVPGTAWGGTVYQAPDGCYYAATGNEGETAFFILKFSADWTLLGKTAIGKNESYTSRPFDAGNSDMVLVDRYLIVHAARGRQDGHQSNATFFIDSQTMEPLYITGTFGFSHVSHSFSQFIGYDGSRVILIDQGDGYPRAVYLQSFRADITEEGLTAREGRTAELFPFWGEVGNNYTGATVDGFEVGQNGSLVAGTSIPHDQFQSAEEYKAYKGCNNVYLILVNGDQSSSRLKWLTSYGKDTRVRNLKMIPMGNDQFALLYGIEEDGEAKATACKIVDSQGNVLRSGEARQSFYCTSEPAYADGKLVWCHYVDSELGSFLVQNCWDVNSGNYVVRNLEPGAASQISRITSSQGNAVESYTVEAGREAKLQARVYSKVFGTSYPTAPAVWRSSDLEVAEVLRPETILSAYVSNRQYKDVETTIKAKKAGTATITCEVGDRTWSAKIQVGSRPDKAVKITSVKLSGISGKLAAGKKVRLTATVKPGNAADQSLSWSSSNKKYATVDKNGRVTLKKAGAGKTVTITAKAEDGSGKKASFKIIVMKDSVKSVAIKKAPKSLKAGKTVRLKTQVKTSGKKANKTLKWKSSKTKYATVSKKGTVKALKAGKGKTVTITAMATDGSGKKSSVKIKIK